MNNYMECFDELLSAAEENASEERIKNILNDEKMKVCFQNKTFCSDFTALCIARDHAAGINAAKDIIDIDNTARYHGSISFFLPLLSGKNRRTAQLSCIDLAENSFGLNVDVFDGDKILGYNSMLYMFIVGDCSEALEKFLNTYRLMGVPDDSLSDYIRIAAKRKKTELIKLFTKRGFTVSAEDMKYLYERDEDYADILIESEIITLQSEADEAAENIEDETNCGDIQIIKNWTVKTDIDRIEFSGNVFDSLHGLPDGRFHSFEAAYCAELNDEEFIVCEKGSDNNAYILRFDEELKKGNERRNVSMEEIFSFCRSNTADYEKLADRLLSEGDSLSVPGIGYTSRTIQKEKKTEGKLCCKYYYHNKEKTMTRSVLNEKKGVPSFRMSGRDFYMCFDILAEVFDDIMKDKKPCEYTEKIRKMFDSEIGISEKESLIEMVFICLRYYASEGNYSETIKLLKEYGLDHGAMLGYDSTDFVFDLLNAESAEAKTIAYKRIKFRPDLNVFSIIPFFVGNIIGAIDESFEFRYFRSGDVSKILCWLAEKRERSAVLKLSRICGCIKDIDLFELALRSPNTVYDFIQNDFYRLVPDNLKKDGVVKSVDEMIRTLTYADFTKTGYFTLISNAYTFFDKKDLEFILSRMPKIKYVDARALNEIYRNEINYSHGAYDGKPEIACYFDRQFSENVHICGNDFAIHPTIKNELRSKLKNHRFTVSVYHLGDIILGLPKNFDFVLSHNIDMDKFIDDLIKSGNRRKIIAAVRHNILNESNIENIIEQAVEKHYYDTLKVIYRIFNLKDRKRYYDK